MVVAYSSCLLWLSIFSHTKFGTPNPSSHLDALGPWKSSEPVRVRHHEDTRPRPGAVPLPVGAETSTRHVLLVVQQVDLLEVHEKYQMFSLEYFRMINYV